MARLGRARPVGFEVTYALAPVVLQGVAFVAVAAPVGVPTAPAVITGVVGAVAVAAPAGGVTIAIPGLVGAVTLAGPVPTVTIPASRAAPVGTVAVSGVVGATTVPASRAAPTGTVTVVAPYDTVVLGVTGTIAIAAPAGVPPIDGVPANTTVMARVGTVNAAITTVVGTIGTATVSGATVTQGSPPAPPPPPPPVTPGTGGTVVGGSTLNRWQFIDPLTSEVYSFQINPSDGGGPFKKQFSYQSQAAPDGGLVIFENQDPVIQLQLTGTLLSQIQYDALVAWFNKPRPVVMIDDLGLQSVIYITGFSPLRKWAREFPYYHTYTLDAYVVSS